MLRFFNSQRPQKKYKFYKQKKQIFKNLFLIKFYRSEYQFEHVKLRQQHNMLATTT